MEIEFSLTVKDLEAFLSYQAGKRRKINYLNSFEQIGFWMAVGVIVGAYLFARTIGIRYGMIAVFCSGALGGMGGSMFAILCLIARVAKSSSPIKELYADENSRWVFSPHHLIITPDGFVSIGDFSQSSFRWRVVWKITVTDDHVFLHVSKHVAEVVPRRVFRDPQHFEEFIHLAQQYQQGAKPTGILASLPPPSTAVICEEPL